MKSNQEHLCANGNKHFVVFWAPLMGVYDPLGLISPTLVAGKLLLRRLYDPQKVTDWDQDIPKCEKQCWASWFASLLDPTEVTFPHSTRPKQAQGRPRLVGFCDAVSLGMCAAIYVVWQILSVRNESRIMVAKCRVTPLIGMTIPRGELQSLTMLTRMLVVVAETYPERFASISTYTDSMSSMGTLGKKSSTLKPYFANRVSEITSLLLVFHFVCAKGFVSFKWCRPHCF